MRAGGFVSSDTASYTKLNEVFLRIKNAMEWELKTIFEFLLSSVQKFKGIELPNEFLSRRTTKLNHVLYFLHMHKGFLNFSMPSSRGK